MTLRRVTICSLLLASSVAILLAQAQRPASALLMDGHVHITNRVYYEGIDPWKPQRTGEWDFARAREGGANVVIENIAPYGYQDYNATVKQVARLLETFHRMMDDHRDKMELALTSADVRRIVASGKMAVLLSIESGFDQEGDIDVLRLWHRLGVRFIQFAGQVTTAYADSSVRGDAKWGGINERGRRLIAEMNRLGIVIDITHATEAGQRQIIEASRAPVVASHVAMKAVCDNPGNMPDDILRALSAKGGLVGIHAAAAVVSPRYFEWSRTHPAGVGLAYALQDAHDTEPRLIRQRPGDAAEYIDALDNRLRLLWKQFYAEPWHEDPSAEKLVPTVDEWADHVVYVVDTVGPSHVAIGLDLTQGRSTLKNFDARSYGEMKNVLTKRKVPNEVLAENWLRVLDAAKVR
jgi:membrane dipeptidase